MATVWSLVNRSLTPSRRVSRALAVSDRQTGRSSEQRLQMEFRMKELPARLHQINTV